MAGVPDVRFCALIPAYNEEARIGAVIAGAKEHVHAVVVVDDGSHDGTAEAAGSAGAHVIRHGLNMGKGKALDTGMRWAVDNGFDAVITLDADGQHVPSEIPRFIDAYHAGSFDVIVGSRMAARAGMPPVRVATNLFTSLVVSLLARRRITDSQSGYRLLKCGTACRLPMTGARFDAESEILVKACRAGMSFSEVPITTVYGDEKSKIHPLKDTVRFFSLVFRLALQRK